MLSGKWRTPIIDGNESGTYKCTTTNWNGGIAMHKTFDFKKAE